MSATITTGEGAPPMPTNLDAIVRDLGLHRAGRWWRGACPICGKDALSATQGRAGLRFICHYGCDRSEVRNALCGGAKIAPDPDAVRRNAESKAAAKAKAAEGAARIWSGADPVTPDDPAGRYLAARGLGAAIGNPALRYRRDVPHPNGGRWPALVFRVDDPDGAPIAIHRVYLTPGGTKAAVDPVKAAKGPIWTGAIRFGVGTEIVVAEGPETALAAGILLNLPAWSSVSAGNLARGLALPADVRMVVIAADHDAPGLAAAEAASRRWQPEGRSVRIVKPNCQGDDFNDVLLAQREGQ